MKKGYLIVFEGIDGTGKTTQISKLATYLRQSGWQVVETREPTDGPFGKKIRELYSNRDQVSKDEELSLFIEDRRQHVAECIEPALAEGKVVLSDRYYYSTAAYQGAAGADIDDIFQRNDFAPVPDVVILLTMSAEESVRRIQELRGESLNDFEQLEQLEKVADIFASFKHSEIIRIDATEDMESVHRYIVESVRKKVSLSHPLEE